MAKNMPIQEKNIIRFKRKNPPGISELVSVVAEYNRAWELELRAAGAVQAPGKNPFMDALYSAATISAQELRQALTVNLNIRPSVPSPNSAVHPKPEGRG